MSPDVGPPDGSSVRSACCGSRRSAHAPPQTTTSDAPAEPNSTSRWPSASRSSVATAVTAPSAPTSSTNFHRPSPAPKYTPPVPPPTTTSRVPSPSTSAIAEPPVVSRSPVSRHPVKPALLVMSVSCGSGPSASRQGNTASVSSPLSPLAPSSCLSVTTAAPRTTGNTKVTRSLGRGARTLRRQTCLIAEGRSTTAPGTSSMRMPCQNPTCPSTMSAAGFGSG